MHEDCANIPETIAFCMGAAILLTLCAPESDDEDSTLQNHKIFLAAGYGKQIPSNSQIRPDARLPDLSFLNYVRWHENTVEDRHLPPYSPDLVAPEAVADTDAAEPTDDVEPEWTPPPAYTDDFLTNCDESSEVDDYSSSWDDAEESDVSSYESDAMNVASLDDLELNDSAIQHYEGLNSDGTEAIFLGYF